MVEYGQRWLLVEDNGSLPWRPSHYKKNKDDDDDGEMWAKPGSLVAGAMFLWVMFQQYTPHQFRSYIEKYSQKLVSFVYPYIQITFQEFSEDRFKRSEAYVAIENYLSVNASTRAKAAESRRHQRQPISSPQHG
ncbi:AAA-ATPase ASD, mitochondrial [Vitis vinifera]|uniref:AAA-ATPase ASD, mitochondrial n=1 Tax=Vitis vinifera TaxID=29760 RepID=A0A438EFK4_VITVI|nr:AAA-ATPase ASD, mitochondrial [Vitis vinifera]